MNLLLGIHSTNDHMTSLKSVGENEKSNWFLVSYIRNYSLQFPPASVLPTTVKTIDV